MSNAQGEYTNDDRLGQGTLCYKDKTMDVGRWRGCSLIKLTMSVLPASVLDIADKRPGESCASVLDILGADFRPPKIKK